MKCCHRLGNLGLSSDTQAGPIGLDWTEGEVRLSGFTAPISLTLARPVAQSPLLAPKGSPTPAGLSGHQAPHPLTATPHSASLVSKPRLLPVPTCEPHPHCAPCGMPPASPSGPVLFLNLLSKARAPSLPVSHILHQYTFHSLPASHETTLGA